MLAAYELLRLFLTFGIDMSFLGWGKCCFSLWISEGLEIPIASRSVNNSHFCSWSTESGLELLIELQREIPTWSSRSGHSLGTGNCTQAINKVLEVAVSSFLSWNLSLLGRLLQWASNLVLGKVNSKMLEIHINAHTLKSKKYFSILRGKFLFASFVSLMG